MKIIAIDSKGISEEMSVTRIEQGKAKIVMPDGQIYYVYRNQMMQALVGLTIPEPKDEPDVQGS
jgi:hypothetical protein